MKQKAEWSPGPGVQVLDVERVETSWVVHTLDRARVLSCLQHDIEVSSWLEYPLSAGPSGAMRGGEGEPQAGPLAIFSGRTQRVGDLAVLLAHAAGGRPAERLMKRLGLTQSDDTLLRSLKRRAAAGHGLPVRVVGVDDWSWRKGSTYGTIMVDLERRQVLDVLADRSAATTAGWLERHPVATGMKLPRSAD
jgi:hypothetical protein